MIQIQTNTRKKSDQKSIFILLIISILMLSGCYPALKKGVQSPEHTLIPVNYSYPEFHDDMDLPSLIRAITRNLEYFNRLDPEFIFQYGPDRYTCQQVRESQKALLDILIRNPDIKSLNKEIKKHFNVYRAAGRVGNRNVLYTGYFDPIYDASLFPDDQYKYPIYSMPNDLVKINLSLFSKDFMGKTLVARIDGKDVLPYYTKKQIDSEKVLESRNLEIAWLKSPIDVTFLHIQGSGRLRLPDGTEIPVGYQTANGQAYESIGRYMIDKGFLTKEEMSMQKIREYLSNHTEIIEEVLYHNPSYIFFRILDSDPLGNISVPLTPGRSVALDSRIFPKGALCFISTEKPVIDSNDEITGWTKFSRFFLNQDTGGAIKGSGRADIFWGSDQHAELAAGHMKHDGDLYILIKKPTK